MSAPDTGTVAVVGGATFRSHSQSRRPVMPPAPSGSEPSTFVSGLLAGKNAFVAGGTSGINLAIAHGLAGAGARVAVFSRNAERVTQVQNTLGHLIHLVLLLVAFGNPS